MTKAVLGIIGGSGVYELPGLENVRAARIASPWGEPSAAPRIVAVQEPFRKLIEKAAGFELAAADILAAGENIA